MIEFEEQKTAVKKFNWFAGYMWVVYILAFFIAVPVVSSGMSCVKRKVIDYGKSIIFPKPFIPDFTPDKKERKDRRDKRERRGLDWRFGETDIQTYVKDNLPQVDKDSIIEVGDCFYNSADEIYEGGTPTPGRSISYLKKQLMVCAGQEWESFLQGLTDVSASEKIENMDDVAQLYEIIGDAITDAVAKVQSPQKE